MSKPINFADKLNNLPCRICSRDMSNRKVRRTDDKGRVITDLISCSVVLYKIVDDFGNKFTIIQEVADDDRK